MTGFNLMILAAGYGKRMHNLTHSTPKPLLKINNKEPLRHNLVFFTNLGSKKIIINTHYLHKKIQNFIEEYYLDKKNKKNNYSKYLNVTIKRLKKSLYYLQNQKLSKLYSKVIVE